MDIYHTSPNQITEIAQDGRFGSFLFFANDEYVMTAGDYVTYSIDIDEDEIIEAGRMFYSDNAKAADNIVAEVMSQFDVDEDTATGLIDETTSIFELDLGIEPEDLGEASWDIQIYTARAAVAMGYRGVEVQDEQGTSYMIDMMGRESELQEQGG